MTKNKQSTYEELVADSKLAETDVKLGDKHTVTVREMTGRERFHLAERGDDNKFETALWVAESCLVNPKMTAAQLEKIKTKWLIAISEAVFELSGLNPEAEEEAENE